MGRQSDSRLRGNDEGRRRRSFCLLALVFLLAWPAAATAVPPVAEVEVAVPDAASLQRLTDGGFDIGRVRDGVATVFGDASELARLADQEFDYTVVDWQTGEVRKRDDAYHDYGEVGAALSAFAAAYPGITRLESLGQSVQGRELWALLITDNPDIEEDEPAFKYVSTIHGSEPLGTELCLYLIERLLTDYGINPRITTLVDETAIWIVPLMNPDGYAAESRFNANGRDLNRVFPTYAADFEGTYFDGTPTSVEGREPEVVHVMNWTLANCFTLSANLHTGALVVNYPYDYEPGIPSTVDAPSPDDALFEEIAARYAQENLPMLNSRSFPGGITNGSAWYAITGGMQDWNYRYAGCGEMTLELSDTFSPSAEDLPQYWADNEEAMLVYMEAVHMGARGVVTDLASGAPLWAQVRVAGNAQRAYTDPRVGDYHRLLLPGTYDLEVFAPEHIPFVMRGVTVVDGATARRDVALSDGDLNGSGAVDGADVQQLADALAAGGVAPDVDGGGLHITDLQRVANVALGHAPEPGAFE